MLNFMSKFNFIFRIFGRGNKAPGCVARDRLRLVLIQDRSNVSPQLLETLKEEMIEVISRYLEIDMSSLEVGFEHRENTVALNANIPIIRIKRSTPIPKSVETRPPEMPQASAAGYPSPAAESAGIPGGSAGKRKELAVAGKRGKGKRRYRS
ncbi:MAG: cell division topological specificity factor MinE [Armatimonadetes bacterium]|nr:cell division topological specificity factor MinE [Armatimonadota bacterium]